MKFNIQTIFKTMVCAATPLLMVSCASVENRTTLLPSICDDKLYFCVENENGIIISRAKNRPDFLVVIDDAKTRYEQFFVPYKDKTAIVLGGVVSKKEHENLTKNDFNVILPWLDANNKRAILVDSIRKQIREQSEGLPEEVVESMVAKALAQLPKNKLLNPQIANSALAHELAHLWYMETYWKGKESNAKNNYGSAAPDWLDEMAAVLVEYEEMSKDRNESLGKIVNKGDSLSGLWPLKEYFTMEHPLAKKAQRLNAMQEGKIDGGARVMVLSGEEADKFLGTNSSKSPENFYAQSRGFADYMNEKTLDKAIFETITKAVHSGVSMEEWLTQHGRTYNLPTSIEALQQDWQKWLYAKFKN